MTPAPAGPADLPATLAEFKAALTASGRHADEIGWADDPEARKDEGAVLLRLHPDGSCEVIYQGRGTQTSETHASEQAALQHLAQSWLRPQRVVHVPPDELRPAVEATRRRAQQTLAELRARRRDDADG